MSLNVSAGMAGEDARLKTLTCLSNADPNDALVKEIQTDLSVASSILEMIKDYMALLQDNFNNDALPFRKKVTGRGGYNHYQLTNSFFGYHLGVHHSELIAR